MQLRTGTYGDVLLQAALRENTVEFGSELSLSQDGEHHALQHHGLGALKIHNSNTVNVSENTVSEFTAPPPLAPITAAE